jgi:tetratricopeptide (TPR) repeat protein
MRAGCRATRTARRRPAFTSVRQEAAAASAGAGRLRDTKAGKKLPPLVDSAQAGAAEALYGIGATLTRRGGEDLALVYLQLALYLQPNHPLALLSLADLYESVKKPQMAIKVYERMPASSPLKRNAQIQLATNLDAADRSDEAIKILKGVTAEAPKDIEAIMALGNIERGRKKFSDCATTYTQAIDATPGVTDKNTWVTYYYRGICEERSKQWSKAEADMRKALELQPEQPHVLNYLGYSWIDQGINLDEGMKMIRRAVDQRPTTATSWIRWAGRFTGSAISRRGEEPRARDRPQARGSDHQRPSRRCLLARRADAGSQIPVGPCPRPQARGGGIAEDRSQDCQRSARRHLFCGFRRQEEGRRQGRLRQDFGGCSAMPVLSDRGSRQGQPDLAGEWPPCGRLSRSRKRGGVRRLRRPLTLSPGRIWI